MSATIAREAAPDEKETEQIVPAVEEQVTKEGEPKEETAAELGVAEAVGVEEGEQRHKALAVARIRESSAPTGLKARMVEIAERAKDAATVEACLKAVEEALPDFLRENREESARGEHPAGEVFFRGNAEELSDERAEEIARRQLAMSGLLRGQRVRVAD